MKTEIRIVEPKLAATWLTQSKDNRPLRKSHINYLNKEMKEGRWRLTHQGIAFSPEGNLMDGQHRLQAIKESGMTIPLQVSYYEPGDNINFAFPILDRGLSRSISDITRIDSKIIQIYNVLFGLGVQKRRVPPDDYLILDSKIGHTTRLFLASCPYQRTYYTPSTVRAAAVSQLFLNKSSLIYVSELFAAWGTGNIKNSPPIVTAFMNYIPSLRTGKKFDESKIYAATIYALNESNNNNSRIYITQNTQDEATRETKNMIDIIMHRKDINKSDLVALKDKKIETLEKKLQRKTALDIQAEQAMLSREAKD